MGREDPDEVLILQKASSSKDVILARSAFTLREKKNILLEISDTGEPRIFTPYKEKNRLHLQAIILGRARHESVKYRFKPLDVL